MKVIFIIDSLRRHGAQRFLTHLARGLQQLGYEQGVVVLNRAGDVDVAQALVASGCSIHIIGKIALLFGVGWWRLVEMLKRSKADIVMTILDFADTLGRPAARVARCKVIVTSIQARNLAKPSWRRWLDSRTIRWANRVIFNSREIVSYGCKYEGVTDDQVVVIPNGVGDLRSQGFTLRESFRNRLGLVPETRLLGAMGRLNPQKNYSLLLHVAARLLVDREWRLLFVGDGPQQAELVALGGRLRLSERLIWLGARADVQGWLAAMDIFVHTSDYEGMPNAVMEAMAMGLPVVASNVDGTRELLRDGITGYLVAAGDISGFTQRIDELLHDPEGAQTMGRQAREDILARFSLERMITDHDRLFRSLVYPIRNGNTR